MTPFEVLEHTADIGIVARGRTLAEAFAEAGRGMFSIIADPSQAQARQRRAVAVEAPDLERLLVAWLSELLYLFEVEEIFPCRLQVSELARRTDGSWRLEAVIRGELFDPDRHHPTVAIKAITRHLLRVWQDEDNEYRARVIFDI